MANSPPRRLPPHGTRHTAHGDPPRLAGGRTSTRKGAPRGAPGMSGLGLLLAPARHQHQADAAGGDRRADSRDAGDIGTGDRQAAGFGAAATAGVAAAGVVSATVRMPAGGAGTTARPGATARGRRRV